MTVVIECNVASLYDYKMQGRSKFGPSFLCSDERYRICYLSIIDCYGVQAVIALHSNT